MYLPKKNDTPFICVCFIPKWQFYLPFSVLQLVKSQTFWVEHPHVTHYRGPQPLKKALIKFLTGSETKLNSRHT